MTDSLSPGDYRDPVWLAQALQTHTQLEVASFCGVDPSTISKWVRLHRAGIRSPSLVREQAVSQNQDTDAAIKGLLAYFQERQTPIGRPSKAVVTDRPYLREIIGCDVHAPLHHEMAWEVFLAVCEHLQPEGITLDGDVLDLNMISRFVKRPRAVHQLQTDLDWARDNVFARVNAAAPNATKTLVLGNHEAGRWERYLWERCPEIAELRCLDMEALLGLSEMGWCYEPEGYDLIPGVLTVQHGDRHTSALGGGSALTARKEMIDTGISGVSGHSHRAGKFYRYDNAGYRVWAEGFCLCDQDKMREARVTAHKHGLKKEDWHLGFVIVYHRKDGEAFDIKDVPILQSKRRTFVILNEEEISV